MERRKTSLFIIGLCAFILSVIGVTYAFWMLRLAQTDENNIASSCFEVTLTNEGAAIHLDKAYPILDSDGEQLEPYTFTITNTCDAYAGYQINLESLSKSGDTPIPVSDRLSAQYLKVKINEVDTEGIISILGANDVVTETLNDAYESHKLMTGYLGPAGTENASKDFELRLWLDGALTMEDTEAMNKKFVSKITITTSYLEEEKIPPTVDLELALCENNIIAQGKATPFGDRKISTYEFKIDEDVDWTSNQAVDTKKFTELDPGSHTVSLKVTDSEGMTNETSKTIEVNYEEPTTATLGGKTIDLVTSGNGLYKVGHCDVTGTVDDIGFSKEEYRYAGANYTDDNTDYVHNYVWFNSDEGCTSEDSTDGKLCEKWRIIGLVNVMTSDNQVEQRLKIIRDKSIGNYSWDNKKDGVGSSTSIFGSNDWTDSQLMEMLNGIYYNASAEFDGSDEEKRGLSTTAHGMIDEGIIWNLGGTLSYTSSNNGLAKHWYGYERGETVPSGREKTWSSSNTKKPATEVGVVSQVDTGLFHSVGLMYPSDYGYAVGGIEGNREECLAKELCNWGSASNCNTNDWLKPESGYIWTLSLRSDSYRVFFVNSGGSVDYYSAFNSYGVWPTLYLSSKVQIVNNDNDGSYDNPYELQLVP